MLVLDPLRQYADELPHNKLTRYQTRYQMNKEVVAELRGIIPEGFKERIPIYPLYIHKRIDIRLTGLDILCSTYCG